MTNDAPQKKSIDDLLTVMAALRTPLTGCPWDLEQDFSSIAPYTLEETYEVLDAITRGDMVDLCEELGDLLLQVVYHARMAQELGAFDFSDVADAITRKMVRRHPHVFGSESERAMGPQKGSWDAIKAQERSEKGALKARLNKKPSGTSANPPSSPDQTKSSILNGVPKAQPALVRAIKLQDKAAKVGFDWPSLAPVFEKMREELLELEEVASPDKPNARTEPESRARITEEFGDLMFVIVNVARHLDIDAENALRGANEKFTHRFQFIETALQTRGKTVHDSDLTEMDELWDKAKLAEKTGG